MKSMRLAIWMGPPRPERSSRPGAWRSGRACGWRSGGVLPGGTLAPPGAVAKSGPGRCQGDRLGARCGALHHPEEARMSRRRAWGIAVLLLMAVLAGSVAVAAPPKD